MSKRVATKQKVETKVKTTKVTVEPSKRVEEVIVIKKKVNPYIDNYSYVETKNILNTNPRFQVVVEHRRKGDILGGGNFEETSYQRQVFSQGGNRPKLPPQDQKLRGNKSEVKMVKQTAPRTGTQTTTTTKKTTTRTTTTSRDTKTRDTKPKDTKTRDKNPVSSSGKKEKIEETTMRRRNEGTGTKTQTKTETKTTSSGLRGQQQSKTSSKTTTTTTKLGDKDDGAKSRTRKREAKK
jgi:hypothetical protein